MFFTLLDCFELQSTTKKCIHTSTTSLWGCRFMEKRLRIFFKYVYLHWIKNEYNRTADIPTPLKKKNPKRFDLLICKIYK